MLHLNDIKVDRTWTYQRVVYTNVSHFPEQFPGRRDAEAWKHGTTKPVDPQVCRLTTVTLPLFTHLFPVKRLDSKVRHLTFTNVSLL